MSRSLGREEENQYSEEEVEVLSSMPMQCCFALLLPGPGCCRMLLGLEAFPHPARVPSYSTASLAAFSFLWAFLCLNPELGAVVYLRAAGSRPQPAPAQF